MEDLKDLPLPQQLLHWARARPDTVALRQKEFGVWQPVTWAEYARRARWFGLGLLQLGLAPGQSLAVLSENCQEWVYAELGAALVRAVTAGVYPTSPAPEVEYLLALCEAPVIVCEDQEQLDKVLEVRERLPHLRAIVRCCTTSTPSSRWAGRTRRRTPPPRRRRPSVRRSTTSG